jgi:hypothetical protein
MRPNGLVLGLLAVCACGVPKDYVRLETTAAFDNAASVAAHVKAKCSGAAADDEDCKQSNDKLVATCQSLDELNKKGDGKGFDCKAWKAGE